LHVAPHDQRRSGIANYAKAFHDALTLHGKLRVQSLAEVSPAFLPKFEEIEIGNIKRTADHLVSAGCLNGYDLIHAEIGVELSREFFFAYWLSRRLEIPLVLTLHDAPYTVNNLQPYWDLSRARTLRQRVTRRLVNVSIGALFENDLMRRAALVIVLNHRAKKALQKRFRIQEVRVIPHLVPTKDVISIPKVWNGVDTLRLLFFGFVYRPKGLHVLIDALGVACDEPAVKNRIELVVCGGTTYSDADQTYYEELQSKTVKLGLEANIKFVGFVPEAEVEKHFSRAHVIVLPYLEAKECSTSGPLIHAMSMGLVPIVTNVRAMDEIIRDGHNGFLVPPENTRALAGRIGDLVRSPQLIAQMSQAAIRTVRGAYSWQSVGTLMSTIYQDAVTRRASCNKLPTHR
jgi:Glycosyltransferase